MAPMRGRCAFGDWWTALECDVPRSMSANSLNGGRSSDEGRATKPERTHCPQTSQFGSVQKFEPARGFAANAESCEGRRLWQDLCHGRWLAEGGSGSWVR